MSEELFLNIRFQPNLENIDKLRSSAADMGPAGTYRTRGRFHCLRLTLQLTNPRLRDNRGLSRACVPSSSASLTAHLTCDLTSFPSSRVCDWLSCRSNVPTLSGHINYNNYCNAFDKRNNYGFGCGILFLVTSKGIYEF